nr:hypothetical protein [Stutzerimonas stutzeri]
MRDANEAPRMLRSVIEANTDAVEEYAVIISVLRITAALEQELIFRHCSNERLVLNPVFESDLRAGHEGLIDAITVDTADAGTDERPRLAVTEVVVIEHASRAIELDALTLGIPRIDSLPDAPQGRFAQILPPTSLYGKHSIVKVLVAASCATECDLLVTGHRRRTGNSREHCGNH